MEPSAARRPSEPLGRLARLFVHPEERRLRAGWRILLTLGLLGALSAATQLFFGLVFGPGAGVIGRFSLGGLFLLGAALALLVVGAGCRFLDRRPLTDLGFRTERRWWLDLVFGTLIGGVLMLGILGAEEAMGWASYSVASAAEGEAPPLAYLPVLLLVFLAIGFYEELVFRGYLITNLAEGMRGRRLSGTSASVLAAAITSVIFGVAHALNPHASVISTANIVMAGVMLALGYLLTAELALPIGLHLGWNLFQNLLGMPVSGQSNFHFGALLERQVSGPAWVTGGDFGPEAGLTGLMAMALGSALIVAWIRLRGGRVRVHPALSSWGSGPQGLLGPT